MTSTSFKAPPLSSAIAQVMAATLMIVYCVGLMLRGSSGSSLLTTDFADVLGMMALGPAIASWVCGVLILFCQRAMQGGKPRHVLAIITMVLNTLLHLPPLALACTLLSQIRPGQKLDPDPAFMPLTVFPMVISVLALTNVFLLWRARRRALRTLDM